MRKIAGPGHVGNAFADYDPPGTPTGTYVMADWGNDVQDELRGIEDEFSIAEAAGTNKYVLAAIIGLAIQHGKPLGELFFMNEYKAPAAFDKDNPEDYFPALCLNTGDQDIAVANWPDLVPKLRAYRLTWKEGIANDRQFNVENWAVSSNVATLTFTNTTTEKAIISALTEDELVHGNFVDWRSINLPSAIGNIPAGEYAISGIDPSALTITFDVTASDGSGAVSTVADFYLHRIPGSSTTARVYERPAGVLVAANDADGECIAGMRRRDRGQGHGHNFSVYGSSGTVNISASNFHAYAGAGGTFIGHTSAPNIDNPNTVTNPIADPVNGEPRTGKTTDPRAMVGHLFMWGREFVA